MLETTMIQTRGFHNTVENGVVTGFVFRIRLNYYRGIFLSQLRPGSVIVDGVKYDRDTLIWEINGTKYTPEEMKQLGNVHWNPLDTAAVYVTKEGGLESGYHEINMGYAYSSSYLPPQLQNDLDPDTVKKDAPPGFGPTRCTRTLLLV